MGLTQSPGNDVRAIHAWLSVMRDLEVNKTCPTPPDDVKAGHDH